MRDAPTSGKSDRTGKLWFTNQDEKSADKLFANKGQKLKEWFADMTGRITERVLKQLVF